jgi:hypothetical protein
MSCHISDKLINFLLGRPATISGIHDELSTVLDDLDTSNDSSLNCVFAVSAIVTIIDNISTELYSKQDCRPGIAKQLLHTIDAWRESCWPSILQASPKAAIPAVPELPRLRTDLVGTIHVSCLYYFAVMLASRPVFVSMLSTHWAPNSEEESIGEACLDAAVYLVQTCVEAYEAGLLSNSMCIME